MPNQTNAKPERKQREASHRLADSLRSAAQSRPLDHLGCHPLGNDGRHQLTVWFPGAVKVACLDWNEDLEVGEMTRTDESGLFERVLDQVKAHPFLCRFRVTYPETEQICLSPYLLGEIAFTDTPCDSVHQHQNLGSHYRSFDYHGQPVSGTRFAVYAPNARNVSVIGDFNWWNGAAHPMQPAGDGIWRLFIPDAKPGQAYKFELHSRTGDLLPHKTDPYAYQIDQHPSFASRIYEHDHYQWQDQEWQTRQAGDPLKQALNIYELHAGSWRFRDGKPLSYRELADELIPYITDMGYTHIEFMPLSEHPFTGSWGYQPVGLFAATSRYGTPDDFKYLVDRCHQAGIGVLMDWVPAHFPTDAHGLANFDGTTLYEYEDPRKGWHPDWNSLIYDYGRETVADFLIGNALYWLEVFHIDGLRVDAVASMLYLDYSRKDGEWVPNVNGGNHNLEAIAFIKRLNETIYLNRPSTLMIAEESTAYSGVSKPTFTGGLGFGFKWNMGWMNDTLRYMQRDHIYRSHHHQELTFGMMYAHSEHFVLAISHDEVVHGKRSLVEKMPGDDWQRFANLRALTAYQMTHPGKKLSFMGQDIGQYREWNHEQSLDWHLLENSLNRGQQSWVRDLNHCYRRQTALWQKDFEEDGFRWLVVDDAGNSILAYLRFGETPENHLLVLINLTPMPRSPYEVGVPLVTDYEVLLNSDDTAYGGSGFSSNQVHRARQTGMHGQPASLCLEVPPLSAMILKPKP